MEDTVVDLPGPVEPPHPVVEAMGAVDPVAEAEAVVSADSSGARAIIIATTFRTRPALWSQGREILQVHRAVAAGAAARVIRGRR